jgi:hypothetical protein
MRSAWFRRLGLAAVAGLLAIAGGAATVTGCASPRDEINRVQPLAIKKSDLVGDYRNPNDAPEFYMRSLILEVQRTNPWFSDGLQDLTRRIRFEITERHLVARNAYEYLQGSDGKGGIRGKANNGVIVAMWPIVSHFNIQRSYNPNTGEETNVIEENFTDRPWYEREYMRVDWSQNLVSDPNQIFWGETLQGGLVWKPVAYFEHQPGKPEASNFAEIGSGYFDVTSKWLAAPETFNYYGYQVPYCLLQNLNLYPSSYNADGSIECNDQEVTLRSSFWKVPTGEASTDYEVHEKTQWEGNIMGNLTLDRSGYDREYGVVDQTWHTYIMKYNIWQKSHLSNECGANNDRAEGDKFCATVNLNSTCDLNAKRCTIPLEERTIRKLAFYLDPLLPQVLEPATARALGEWNVALSRAVGYAREAECRRLGGERETCHEKYFDGPVDPKKEDVPKLAEKDVVVMCHNPVVESDDREACGPVGKVVRKGDIRHHMIAWWNNPSFNRPLGVVVWSGDPTTGENIGTLINIFGASVETYTAQTRDTLQLIAGDFTPSEYAAGLPREVYSNENFRFETDPVRDPVLDSYQSKLLGGTKNAITPRDLTDRLAAVDVEGLQKSFGADKVLANIAPVDRIQAWNKHVAKQSTIGDPRFQDPNAYLAQISKRMEGLQKGGFEPKIVNDLWASSVGIDPKLAHTKTGLDVLSPFRGMNPAALKQQELLEMDRKRQMHMCSLEMPEMLRFNWQAGYAAKLKARYPDGSVATGEIAKRAGVEGQQIDRFVRGKLIYQELLEPMYEFTVLHEIGHLMSMQHDFSGSWDSPNFYPEYWILRSNADKKVLETSCQQRDGTTLPPEKCVGPRWLDPVTPDELGIVPGDEHDSIDAYAVSSVMDYKFDSLYAARLGQMDKMSAKYIYAGIAELFDDDDKSLIKNSTRLGATFRPVLTVLNTERWIVGRAFNHYTEIGRKLSLFDPGRCREQTPEEKARGIGAKGLVCAPPHKDHAFLRDLVADVPAGFPADFWTVQFAREKVQENGTGPGAPNLLSAKSRWPYKVGDGRVSYVHQYFYDNGADFYEVTEDILERYELMYLDYFFRKGSRERSVNRAGAAMYNRFFDRIQALQWNALSDVVRNGRGVEGSEGNAEDQARVIALTRLFDAMQTSLLRPQPGSYKLDRQPGSLFDVYTSIDDAAGKGDFNLGAGDARYIDHKFDVAKQYDFLAYPFRGGSFLEKPFASIALTDARPQLSTVARETYLDGRNVMFSFRNAIPQAFDRLVAGVFADDWDTIAPHVSSTAKGTDMASLTPVKLWETKPELLAAPRPAGARLVDPMLGFRVKVPAIMLMLLYQPIDSSMDLVNPEAIAVTEAERVVFFDPVDGMEWNAKSFGTETIAGKVVDTGIGARMLQHANELMVVAYGLDTKPVAPGSNQVVALYDAGHRPLVGGKPIAANPEVKDAKAAAKLREYVAFLNQVRTAMYYLGFGPCGFGRGC